MSNIEKLEEMLNNKDKHHKNEMINVLSKIHQEKVYLEQDLQKSRESYRELYIKYKNVFNENMRLRKIIDVAVNSYIDE